MPKSTCCRICKNLLKDSVLCYGKKCPHSFKTFGDLIMTYAKPCNYCDIAYCEYFEKINMKVKQ